MTAEIICRPSRWLPAWMLRAFFLAFLLASCTSLPTPLERADRASRLASDAGWSGEVVEARRFAMQTYFSQSLKQAETLTVYIEGDGLAWVSTSNPSFDPTPIDALALKLALKDPGPAVYLGRPCQFTMTQGARGCEQKYWTSHRFAPEVIAASDEAIDSIKARFGARHLVLVGYSGGGAVAALLAARRQDVTRLVTVAGNLDHRAWTRQLRLSPLTGSLNPADFAEALSRVPQIHFVGGKDKILGEYVAQSYADQFNVEQRSAIVVMPEFTHHCCWVEQWPALRLRAEGAQNYRINPGKP